MSLWLRCCPGHYDKGGCSAQLALQAGLLLVGCTVHYYKVARASDVPPCLQVWCQHCSCTGQRSHSHRH